MARVNGRPVPLRHARIIADQALLGRAATPEARATAYRRAVDQLVTRDLLYEEAQRRKIQPDEAAVKETFDRVRGEHADEAAWTLFLREQGLDTAAFLSELRVRHTVEAVIKDEVERMPPTVDDAEARAYYKANPELFTTGGVVVPFEDVRSRIEKQLVTFKRQERLNLLLTRLREAARIESFL